jgi:hypothetical protein
VAVWTVTTPAPNVILDALDGAHTPEEASERLLALGLRDEEVRDAIEIVGMASSRALLLSAGLHRDQFHGDLEDDPLFRAALQRLGHDTAGQVAGEVRPRTSFGGIFALVGLCLLVVVFVVWLMQTLTHG